MRILLLGKTGLLGSEFLQILEESGMDFDAPTHHELDLLDFEAVDKFLAREYFDRILYCAAYTDVDKAEEERGTCERMNVGALKNVIAHRQPIIHFSSDYVFNAPSGIPIPENFPREPINFYGETKKKAEIALETSGTDFWNIRTSWLFGSHGRNFISKILELSKEKEVLEVVGDQVGLPTSTKDLAQYIFQNFVLNAPTSGHYHLQNSGDPVSWADFAEYILRQKKWAGRIERISSDNLPNKAHRPKNSILLNTKLPTNLRNWHLALEEFLSL